MGFAGEGQSVYPIVNCDLSDVVGAPGLPDPLMSSHAPCPSPITRGNQWAVRTLVPGNATPPGAFEPFQEQLDQKSAAERVQATFQSTVCEQVTHQQMLRGRPVVGARFRTVSSPSGSVVLRRPSR